MNVLITSKNNVLTKMFLKHFKFEASVSVHCWHWFIFYSTITSLQNYNFLLHLLIYVESKNTLNRLKLIWLEKNYDRLIGPQCFYINTRYIINCPWIFLTWCPLLSTHVHIFLTCSTFEYTIRTRFVFLIKIYWNLCIHGVSLWNSPVKKLNILPIFYFSWLVSLVIAVMDVGNEK